MFSLEMIMLLFKMSLSYMAFLPHDSPPKPVPLHMQRTIVALIRETLSLGRRKANLKKERKKEKCQFIL